MQLSIVIPVYNEQATIIELLDRVAAVNIEKEVIVVDDFSTDGTRALLENYRNEAFTLLLPELCDVRLEVKELYQHTEYILEGPGASRCPARVWRRSPPLCTGLHGSPIAVPSRATATR